MTETTKRGEEVRMILATDPDGAPPSVVGALSESTYEILPDEDWNRVKLAMVGASGIDRRDYLDLIEVVVRLDGQAFAALGRIPTLDGGSRLASSNVQRVISAADQHLQNLRRRGDSAFDNGGDDE